MRQAGRGLKRTAEHLATYNVEQKHIRSVMEALRGKCRNTCCGGVDGGVEDGGASGHGEGSGVVGRVRGPRVVTITVRIAKQRN